jgi:RNA polymerase sigma factor (sigma-70 family)
VRKTPTESVERPELRAAYERHAEALLRLAVLLSTRQDDGEDLVQDVFLSAAERIPQLPEDAWLPYLRAAVVNRWKNARRRDALERKVAAESLPVSVGREDDLAMWAAISNLPRRQRACLVLRYYEDLTIEDTAALLGCSTGTVKSQSSRALARLAREWDT